MTTPLPAPAADAEPPRLAVVLPRVAADIRAVGKDQRNETQNYRFRGIDDLLNAVHEPLARHGVSILPTVVERIADERTTRNGAVMTVVVLTMDFTFVGPAGDTLVVRTIGEAHDTADKATNKAMSAAMKYALILTFTVPTADMDDADRTTAERPAVPPAAESLARIDAAAALLGRDRDGVTRLWRARTGHTGPLDAVPPATLATLAAQVETAVAAERVRARPAAANGDAAETSRRIAGTTPRRAEPIAPDPAADALTAAAYAAAAERARNRTTTEPTT
jgi:hypothetical protein